MNKLLATFTTLPLLMRYLLIAVVAAGLFLPYLGGVHLFDWDEINFAECAREMLVSKDYLRNQIDFMPFWEKPPVFIWMQVLAMQAFGVGEYAARLPNAIVGIATLVTIYYCGRRVVSERFALLWVALYAGSWLPHFYFKTGIIDPTFNYFIFLSFFQLHLLKWDDNKWLHALLAGLFLGLAVLTKGPVAALVLGLCAVVYAIMKRGLKGYAPKYLVMLAVSACLPFALWILAAIVRYGMGYAQWFLTEFVTYQIRLLTTEDADHGGPFIYHFVVLLLGCFPASIFFFNGLGRRTHEVGRRQDFAQLMNIMFWVVLLLFSFVKTKIVHYSSLCYFPLTYLAARQLSLLLESGTTLKRWAVRLLIGISCLIGLLLALLPIVGMYPKLLLPLLDDPFAAANLNADVQWSYAHCLWGVAYAVCMVPLVRRCKAKLATGVVGIILLHLVVIQAGIYCFTPRIEAYSQRAAIDYFKRFKGQNVYIAAIGFKSYAYLFYADKQPFAAKDYISKGRVNEHWLVHGNIDHPAYFITKIQDAPNQAQNHQLEKIGAKNGFVFFRRRDSVAGR
jgi:4-amino-4-deoxy-L-arabinose transferase-like glycosyltransferase